MLDRKEFPMMKKNPKSKEPALYVPVSPKDSVGQELYRYASLCRKLIIALFVIVGIIVGIFVGGEGGPIACIFLGIIGWLLGSLVADNATIFIDAKAELLINTAKIQADLDYLCKVKEYELAAQQKADEQVQDMPD